METLSNVEDRKPCLITPGTIPEARGSKTGVSVRYVPAPDHKWFVFRASYGREDLASDFIIEDNTYAYVAKHQVRKMINGKQKKVLESLIPNLLFVYTTHDKAERYVKDTPTLAYLSYYYNHFVTDDYGKNPPLIIPLREMENFILATCGRNEHVMLVQPSQVHYRGGEMVRITDGAFRSVVGRVARVAGQQRVVVNLSGIGLVSTAYIPTAFLQPINN